MKFRIVEIDLPSSGNFMWLESLTFEKNSSRIVHVIKPASTGQDGQTEFKMGRSHESDLRVCDISISRCHAILKYDANDSHGYYLEDNLSKFGTLVLATTPTLEIDESQTKAIQIGRSVISFCLKRQEQQAFYSNTASNLLANNQAGERLSSLQQFIKNKGPATESNAFR